MKRYLAKKDDVSVVLCGAAGQGIETVEALLTTLFKRSGYNLFSTKEYMSRVRGGSNSTELRVSSGRAKAYLKRIDILIPLNREALRHVKPRLTDETIILGEKDKLQGAGETAEDVAIIDVPFTNIAAEIGGPIYINVIATGLVAALFDIEKDLIAKELTRKFASKGEAVLANNIRAFERGYEIGADLLQSGTVAISVQKDVGIADEIIISGGEAVSMGAIAGGCNFISSYPMTPSTSVLTFLARQSQQFDIIVDQAEDEIAAMNMAIGAWYAGARAMVTTSGGGFALMTEGLSLAGMLESPMVIHLGQRPGPATGLPTRTEQADLNLALYAGHGEFPRVIFAPGTLEEAFELSAKAFNMADKYQVPVFILTDQYLVDSYYNIPRIDVSGIEIERHVVVTDEEYRRYAPSANGVSPRGIPGNGTGVVVVDSDEHDYEGHITEDHQVRVDMVEKRLSKGVALLEDAVPPKLVGSAESSTAVICWGSTFNIANEAIGNIGSGDIALVHFSQVYPLHAGASEILKKFDRRVLVENNATSQFAGVLKIHGGTDVEATVNKYDGLAFSVEELEGRLRELLKL